MLNIFTDALLIVARLGRLPPTPRGTGAEGLATGRR